MSNNLPKVKKNFNLDNIHGFTLIEIVIVIATMALLFGLGYANYRNFARRQKVQGVVKQLKSDLRLAQQLAITGQKPETGCGTLDGYQFYIRYALFNPDQYEIRPRCDGSAYSEITKIVEFPEGTSLSSTTGLIGTITFNVLGRGVDISSGSTPAVITVGYISHLTGGCAFAPLLCVGQWLDTDTATISESGEIY